MAINQNFLEELKERDATDLHSFATATSGSTIVFMRGTIFLDPERVCPIFNKTSRICWNLFMRHISQIPTPIDYK